jgi:hypothetical protein
MTPMQVAREGVRDAQWRSNFPDMPYAGAHTERVGVGLTRVAGCAVFVSWHIKCPLESDRAKLGLELGKRYKWLI